MDSNKIIEQHLAANNQLIQTNQSNIRIENVKSLREITPDFIMFGGIISFVICWAAIFFMLSKRVRVSRKEITINSKTLHQIPCKSCKFYSNEPHLKCAVNPSIVLTEKAINCSDYLNKANKLI